MSCCLPHERQAHQVRQRGAEDLRLRHVLHLRHVEDCRRAVLPRHATDGALQVLVGGLRPAEEVLAGHEHDGHRFPRPWRRWPGQVHRAPAVQDDAGGHAVAQCAPQRRQDHLPATRSEEEAVRPEVHAHPKHVLSEGRQIRRRARAARVPTLGVAVIQRAFPANDLHLERFLAIQIRVHRPVAVHTAAGRHEHESHGLAHEARHVLGRHDHGVRDAREGRDDDRPRRHDVAVVAAQGLLQHLLHNALHPSARCLVGPKLHLVALCDCRRGEAWLQGRCTWQGPEVRSHPRLAAQRELHGATSHRRGWGSVRQCRS
mmetsp:Transcript_96765/g.279355  ORF Transcript_96765/g.279355 Transcript_96765/m.279355 type:complete len:316 (-) Transcript_96765:32-979(-)